MSTARFFPAVLALSLATLVAALATASASSATLVDQASDASVRCKAVAKGMPWSYNGKKGSLYTIEGNRTWTCAVGVKWLLRLTNVRGLPPKVPGFVCHTSVSFPGDCENRSGAIFAWNNKPG